MTAVPATGYHFVKWSDDVSTASRTDTNVTADISVTASFAIDTFTLTYAAGTHGTISGDCLADACPTAATAPPSPPCRPPATTSSSGATTSDRQPADRPQRDRRHQRHGELRHRHLHADLRRRHPRHDQRRCLADASTYGGDGTAGDRRAGRRLPLRQVERRRQHRQRAPTST